MLSIIIYAWQTSSDDALYLPMRTLIKFFSPLQKLSELTISLLYKTKSTHETWFFVTGTALVIAMRYVAG